MTRPTIKVFSTCPQSRDVARADYVARAAEAARWSDAAGCEGILVYTDNGIVDPWLLAQMLVTATERLCPLVAVQPLYMHPFSVAKMVATIAHLHDRRVYLNLLAGGFRNDLTALGDDATHDERYARLAEYARIVKELTESAGPVSCEGRYYRVRGLRLAPPVPTERAPGFLVSGSSPAGLEVAHRLDAIAVSYPASANEETPADPALSESGIRIGIIVRDDHEEAWRVAHDRFPPHRSGQIAHQLAARVSDSDWHRALSGADPALPAGDDPYWLGPFQNYQSFCPYLVGDREQVSAVLRRYVELGHTTFILDVPAEEQELRTVVETIREAAR